MKQLLFHFLYVLKGDKLKKILNNIGVKVSLVTVVINFILFVFKLIAGIIAHSNAMISDAVHSLSDVITTVAVIFGLILANQEEDKEHPYGHERIESVFAIVLSFFLFLTGIGIGILGIKAIMRSTSGNLNSPGVIALIAAVCSIFVKEFMFHYTMRTAKKIKSSSMEADAWHHRSDALSSIGSFIGILGARLGLPILDPICSLLICILIVKTSIEIFMEAISQLIDKSCDEETNGQIIANIMEIEKNIDINDFKTRIFGNKIYIDAEIAIDGNLTLDSANKIVEKIHDTIEENFNSVKHCNIHIVPKK